MKLIEIDKITYREHLNRVIIVFIACLAFLSLLMGQLLIRLWGQVEVATGESTGNFHLNFLGVLLAFALCGGVLYRQRHHAYFKEIYYVSRLKALHNRIYRKLKAIKLAAQNNDVNALIILSFYYTSLKFVYLLDDNTLTLGEVDVELNRINQQIERLGLTVGAQDFSAELLTRF